MACGRFRPARRGARSRAIATASVTLVASLCYLSLSQRAFSQTASPRSSQSPANNAADASADWEKRLFEGDLQARRAAAKSTLDVDAAAQSQALPFLIRLLMEESDGQIRLAVFDTITQMGPAAEQAIPALEHAIRTDFGGRSNEEIHQNYRAAIALSSIGKPSVEALKDLLNEESASIRAEASMALGRIGPAAAAAVPALVALLDDTVDRVRRDATEALGRIGADAVPSLIDATQSGNARQRAAALVALGTAAPLDRRVSMAASVAADDADSTVQAAAIRMLAQVSTDRSALRDRLLRALVDDHGDVRAAAFDAMIEDQTLILELRENLAGLLTHQNEEVSLYAAFLLQKLDAAAVPILLSAARDPATRVGQLAGVLSLVDAELEPYLFAALDSDEPRAVSLAAQTLGKRRPLRPETIGRLAEGLSHPNRDCQESFLLAIADLGVRAREAMPTVLGLLEHPDVGIRKRSIEVLASAADRNLQLANDLSRFITDEAPAIQIAAIDSLRTFGPLGRDSITVAADTLSGDDASVRKSALFFIASHGAAAAPVVPQLRQQLLRNQSDDMRVLVIETLGKIGEGARDASPDLLDMLSNPSPKLRIATLQTLSNLRLDIGQLRDPLFEGLQDADEDVRSQAYNSLRRLGPAAGVLVPELIAMLNDERTGENVGKLLDRMLRYPTENALVPALNELLDSPNTQVQLRAAQFLGLAGSAAKQSLTKLSKLATSSDLEVKDAATKAIEQISESSQ